MTSFSPHLALRRLVIYRNGGAVYDQMFHLGVNAITGENGSGKSTIADFIFFALGGELLAWREAAKLCDSVFAEVSINGEIATLRREVSSTRQQPMSVCWDGFDEASGRAAEGWQRYSFAVRGTQRSFSQVLFNALGVPEVRGTELTARLTMHQLLRLMYADQLSPPTSVFRFEQFDSNQIRDAAGSLLCGLYNSRRYEIDIRLNEAEVESGGIRRQLESVTQLLTRADQTVSSQFLEQTRENTIAERRQIQRLVQQLEQGSEPNVQLVQEHETQLSQLRGDLRAARVRREELLQHRQQHALEIADTEELISTLGSNLDALDDAEALSKELGKIPFRFCPSCYTLLRVVGEGGRCPLCKEETEDQKDEFQILAMKEEIANQIRESEQNLEEVRAQLDRVESQLPGAEAIVERLQIRYDELFQRVGSNIEAQIWDLHQRAGYLDRQIEDLDKQIALARSLDLLTERRGQLADEITRLRDEKGRLDATRQAKERSSRMLVSRRTAELLRADLPREAEYPNATTEDVWFSFGDNTVLVRDRANFSASSLVILRNSFHLALLLASCDDQNFNYPRFALFDSIEDKGMQPDRSHNFQVQLLAALSDVETEHQVILTTSMIAPELDRPEIVVGNHYSHSRKTLDIESELTE